MTEVRGFAELQETYEEEINILHLPTSKVYL